LNPTPAENSRLRPNTRTAHCAAATLGAGLAADRTLHAEAESVDTLKEQRSTSVTGVSSKGDEAAAILGRILI